MTALETACTIARRFEGCRLGAYRDAVGYPTIGWGHLLSHDKASALPDASWIQEQADEALASDMAQFIAGVRRLVTVPATDNQIAALGDFAFNLGLRSLRASTLLRLVNDGDMKGVADQFPKWVFAGGIKLPGLIRRRQAEATLWAMR